MMLLGNATSLLSMGRLPSVMSTGSSLPFRAVEMASPLTLLPALETVTPLSKATRTPLTPSMPFIRSRWKSPTVVEYTSFSACSLNPSVEGLIA